jgi:hypothetical protein
MAALQSHLDRGVVAAFNRANALDATRAYLANKVAQRHLVAALPLQAETTSLRVVHAVQRPQAPAWLAETADGKTPAFYTLRRDVAEHDWPGHDCEDTRPAGAHDVEG